MESRGLRISIGGPILKATLYAFLAISLLGRLWGESPSVPLRRSLGGHLLVDVVLRTSTGRRLEAVALIDMGAGRTVINQSLLFPEERHSFSINIEDGTSSTLRLDEAAWVDVTQGPAELGKIQCILMDLDRIKPKDSVRLDIILGVEAFKNKCIGFDLKNNRVFFSRMESPELDLPLIWNKWGLPGVHGSLNGHRVPWFLDTGTKFQASIPRRFASWSSGVKGNSVSYSGVSGKKATAQSSKHNSIVLGDITFADQEVWADDDDEPRIGPSFFPNCVLEFDFPLGRFRLRRAPSQGP